jgi:V-type H+-transporting ATPase subunit E
MEERNKCLLVTKAAMKEKLISERTDNRERYLETVKQLIFQSMIKLLEPSLKILCREEDESDIQGFLADLSNEYHEYMLEKTERDEYECTLEVFSGEYLTDDKDMGCGGVILYTENQRIVCPNTLYNRLNLAFEEMLP